MSLANVSTNIPLATALNNEDENSPLFCFIKLIMVKSSLVLPRKKPRLLSGLMHGSSNPSAELYTIKRCKERYYIYLQDAVTFPLEVQ